MFTLAELEAAASLVHAHMAPTPQYAWPLLGARVGAEVWVKHENHTPTGAFKLRGGLTYLADLVVREPDCPGLITATRGNHGQSIPFAARAHGLPVTVLVPQGNSPDKNRAIAAWGARLEVFGADFEAARLEAIRRAGAEGLHLVPPFHPQLVRGVASYGLELMRAVPDLATIYVPIGMGSGICSLIAVRDALGLATEIVGVVATGADAFARSFEAGRIVATEAAQTLADGMACRTPLEAPFEIIRRGAARIIRVSDDQIAEAIRALWQDTHQLAEGAGAAGLAALMTEREAQRGARVAVILCGGNLDAAAAATILGGGTPAP